MDGTVIEELLAAVDEARLLRLASELVRIPSLTGPGGEGPVVTYLAELLERAGLEVRLQEVEPGRPNLLATLRGAGPGPRMILCGHTDVVPPGESGWMLPPFSGEVVDGKLFGRGAADMKGPIAAMIEAIRALRESRAPFQGEVLLALVVGEEVGQHGMRHLAGSGGLRGDFGIVGEPTELKPIICHKGLVSFTITTHGRSCHASSPQDGVSAIEHMSRVLSGLQELRARLSVRAHPVLGPATLNVGTIAGGTMTNMVPDACTITVDRRVLPGEEMAAVVAEVETLLAGLGAGDPAFRFTVEAPDQELAMEIPAGVSVVTALRGAAEQVLGSDPGVHGWPATCDANLMVAGGIPTVIYGPGSLGQAHRVNEYVEVEQLGQAARVYALTVWNLLRAGAAGRQGA